MFWSACNGVEISETPSMAIPENSDVRIFNWFSSLTDDGDYMNLNAIYCHTLGLFHKNLWHNNSSKKIFRNNGDLKLVKFELITSGG